MWGRPRTTEEYFARRYLSHHAMNRFSLFAWGFSKRPQMSGRVSANERPRQRASLDRCRPFQKQQTIWKLRMSFRSSISSREVLRKISALRIEAEPRKLLLEPSQGDRRMRSWFYSMPQTSRARAREAKRIYRSRCLRWPLSLGAAPISTVGRLLRLDSACLALRLFWKPKGHSTATITSLALITAYAF